MSEILQWFISTSAAMPRVLLLATRIAAVLALTPVFGTVVPPLVKVLLILGFSLNFSNFTIAGLADSAGSQSIDFQHPGPLLQAVLMEAALGATLSLGIQCAFAIAETIGHLIDIQIGFGISQILDPAMGSTSPIIATMVRQLAIVIFFSTEAVHLLIKGLALSIDFFPLGNPWNIGSAGSAVVGQVGAAFAMAFSFAAPVVLSIMILDFALGIMARTLPQIHMFSFSLGLKISVGLLIFGAWVMTASSSFERIYGAIFSGWRTLFEAAGRT